jgi:hypothetical protein
MDGNAAAAEDVDVDVLVDQEAYSKQVHACRTGAAAAAASSWSRQSSWQSSHDGGCAEQQQQQQQQQQQELSDLPLRLRIEHTMARTIQSVGRRASFAQAAPLPTVEEKGTLPLYTEGRAPIA